MLPLYRYLLLIRSTIATTLIVCAFLFAGPALADNNDVQTAWRLLDYLAVDYGGAVADGKVKSASEFAEMNEFAANVASRLQALPPKPERAALIAGTRKLQDAIAQKRPLPEVATMAHRLAADLLRAYPVPLAPTKIPDFATGDRVFAANCSACHGSNGNGHGPDAAKLSTPPIAFNDLARARQRSIFALYQTATQGIDGTAMAGFSNLSSDERWAAAFRAGGFAFTSAQVAEGEKLWNADQGLHQHIPDLATLVALTPAALAQSIGQPKADAVLAYLRMHPDKVGPRSAGSLSVAREKLAASVAAARRGDRHTAQELALSAYLDGFEPIEPTLTARDATLMNRVEQAMGEYRAAVDHDETADQLNARVTVLFQLFDDAESALSPDAATKASTFIGALTILLREGLEALLIVVAMIAFLRKADRADTLPYVHGGWIGALLAGALTWAVATYAIGISGASRELTEGFGSVFAAAVLLSVGIWMHGKAQANQWQRYIREKMSHALGGRTGWLLFGLAFVVVYREVFETILFYAALSAQGNNASLLAGAGSATLLLGVIAWAMLRYSQKLPVAQFFRYSSWLMAVLTVVLAGKGISALQEAGIVGIAPLQSVPRLSMLGLFPTWQTTVAQAVMTFAIVVGFAYNRRRASLVR